jgi:hemolysin activation/secretion protein
LVHALAMVRRFAVIVAAGLSVAAPAALAAEDNSAKPDNGAAGPQKPQPHFDILEYVIDGNTVLSAAELEEAVYPFLGEDRAAADVDKAREALERLYRERGFQTVQVSIPKQGVENKIVHLQIAENPIGRLRVVDSKYHTPSEIKQTAPSLAEGTVPNLNEVQKDIVRLNQSADLKVTPHLKAGLAPATVDVDLQVEDTLPLHATVEINNQHNQKTTALRTAATISYDNLWQLGHSVSFSYQVAPQNKDDAQVFSGSYLFRIPRSDWSFLAYAVKSDSAVAALANTDVIGKGSIFGGRGIANLPGSDTFFHSLTVGIDRKDLTQNVVTSGIPADAPVLYYPLSIAYAPMWRNDEITTQANASVNFALPVVGSDSRKFDVQRFDALRQYFYAKAVLSRTQPLLWGTQLFVRLEGQVANGPLLSSEQMNAGGANTVRGYLEAERLGDNGLQSTVEVRSPLLDSFSYSFLKDWRIAAFYDSAALWLEQPLPGEQDSFSIASAGVGTRFSMLDVFNGSLDVAFPLVDGSATRAGDPYVHFRFSAGL